LARFGMTFLPILAIRQSEGACDKRPLRIAVVRFFAAHQPFPNMFIFNDANRGGNTSIINRKTIK
jgi:hypothetical protein